MGKYDYLKYMPTFRDHFENGNLIVNNDMDSFDQIIKEWADHIFKQSQKRLTPLFITGSGVSKDKKDADVPDINEIIEDLKQRSKGENGSFKEAVPQDVRNLFNAWEKLRGINKKDRSIVARLLNAFQEGDEEILKDNWRTMNGWLLKKILNAQPTDFHKGLAYLYQRYGAMCLTLNFDNLLIKELMKQGERAFSLPKKEECEDFFLRLKDNSEFIELQVRGDILYLECTTKGYCPNRNKGPQPLWTSFPIMKDFRTKKEVTEEDAKEITKCPCGEERISYLSFPGSYKKEKDMREILGVIWKYLAYRIGSVTVVGMSGAWDPLIVAFLGDLLSERDIPLLIVDLYPDKEKTFVIRELVFPKIHPALALGSDANKFMNKLKKNLDELPSYPDVTVNFVIPPGALDDGFWYNKLNGDQELNNKVNSSVSQIEVNILEHIQMLKKSAQLGLASICLGIDPHDKNHNRYRHSIGVMKIASYIYDRAIENSGLRPNLKERQFLRLAALLHDIGHLPFSHLIEEVFNELHWRPSGYTGSYSHVLHTEEKIEQICKESSIAEEIQRLKYAISDLIRLINGNFGIGYLDAIINSPIDADKIDYVFVDTDKTNRKISLSPIYFLKDIVKGLTITPEKLLAFSGVSAKAARDLLFSRRYLYQNFYRQPGIRILEGIAKQIIITYFVHTLSLDDKEIFKKSSPDLGHYKILYCIKKLERLIDKCSEESLKQAGNILELAVLNLMLDKLDKLPLNKKLKEGIKNGFEKIQNIRSEEDLRQLESEIKYYPFERDDYYEKIIKIAKTCKLRLPGALIIEVVKTPKFFAVPDERKKKKRSDDTETYSECILVPSEKHETWYPSQNAQQPLLSSSLYEEEKKGVQVYLYPLSEDKSYVTQAINLFEKMKEQEMLPMETE